VFESARNKKQNSETEFLSIFRANTSGTFMQLSSGILITRSSSKSH